VLEHGTGALNIDGCRIHAADAQGESYTVKRLKPGATLEKTGGNWRPEDGVEFSWRDEAGALARQRDLGRLPRSRFRIPDDEIRGVPSAGSVMAKCMGSSRIGR
jgi:hypothetical protein